MVANVSILMIAVQNKHICTSFHITGYRPPHPTHRFCFMELKDLGAVSGSQWHRWCFSKSRWRPPLKIQTLPRFRIWSETSTRRAPFLIAFQHKCNFGHTFALKPGQKAWPDHRTWDLLAFGPFPCTKPLRRRCHLSKYGILSFLVQSAIALAQPKKNPKKDHDTLNAFILNTTSLSKVCR